MEDAVLEELRSSLLAGMREYMEDADVSYGEADVVQCAAILEAHVRELANATTEKDALAKLRDTALRLNELNKRCDGKLIETDQREDICAFLIRAAVLRGFNAAEADQTEQWREW